MNSFKKIKNFPFPLIPILFVLFFAFASCWFAKGGGGSTGYIYKYSAALTPPVSTSVIGVRQRSDLSSEIPPDKFKTDENGGYFSEFDLDGLEKDQSYIFEVSGSNFKSTISFPFLKSSNKVFLGGLDISLYTSLIASVTSRGVSVDTLNKGIIVGTHNPLNISEAECGTPVDNVVLINKSTGEEYSGSQELFFFSTLGVVTKGPPPYDGYIMVNVDPGIYNLIFSQTANSSYTHSLEVVVEAREVTFGYLIPCQVAETFEYKP